MADFDEEILFQELHADAASLNGSGVLRASGDN